MAKYFYSKKKGQEIPSIIILILSTNNHLFWLLRCRDWQCHSCQWANYYQNYIALDRQKIACPRLKTTGTHYRKVTLRSWHVISYVIILCPVVRLKSWFLWKYRERQEVDKKLIVMRYYKNLYFITQLTCLCT